MLIEFSVANYRSFRDRQTLSMVAASRLRKRENVFHPIVRGEKFPALLKACVIYGPNASGKSNLLRALDVISRIAAREPSAEADLPVTAFRFDSKLRSEPSVFEIHFIASEVRYQFDLSATSERIIRERLISYPKGEELVLYERRHSTDGDIYDFSPAMDAEPDVLQTWRKLTPAKSLFIAQAVANSSEELNDQLRRPFAWLKGAIFSMLNGMKGMAQASQDLAEGDPVHGQRIATFLQDVDVPVSRIKVLPASSSVVESSDAPPQPGLHSNLGSAWRRATRTTTLTHVSALGEADMSYSEESEGTQNLIGFWLPWTTRESRVPLERMRCVLAVDELDSSLHPKIVAALVAKHLSSVIPTQLIFTTHDTHLMDAKLFRRDQFWIAERDVNGATQLRAVHDFEGREGEDIEKRYYAGRYRGLPQVRGQ